MQMETSRRPFISSFLIRIGLGFFLFRWLGLPILKFPTTLIKVLLHPLSLASLAWLLQGSASFSLPVCCFSHRPRVREARSFEQVKVLARPPFRSWMTLQSA